MQTALAQYILKRCLLMIPTLIGIAIITFAIVHLAPGDPASLKAQSSSEMISSDAAALEVIEQTKAIYGLDKPLYVQFFQWSKRMVKLDFGESLKDHRKVSEKIWEALPPTILLNSITLLLIYLIAIPLGIYTALKPNSLSDKITSIGLLMLYSLPNFWVAMLLIVFLGGGDYLNIFPITGLLSDSANLLPWYGKLGNMAWHLVLPVLCLTYGGLAFLSRFARTSMLEVIRQDYIRTAHAKGLSEWKVVTRHALRNAFIPMLTLIGALLPALISGSVIVEQIFSIPGMGRLGFEAVLARDYPVIMAIATISAVLTLISMLITDILYAIVDPRVSFGAKG